MALGLAAGVILLGQLTYDEKAQAALEKIPRAFSDAGKTLPADTVPIEKPSIFYRLIPHRQLIRPEAIFDGILCALALPAGIYFFVWGAISGSRGKESAEIVDVF